MIPLEGNKKEASNLQWNLGGYIALELLQFGIHGSWVLHFQTRRILGTVLICFLSGSVNGQQIFVRSSTGRGLATPPEFYEKLAI